jgi:hypothetical protein
VVAGTWITITLILFGVMSAALTVGLTTALGWALWHNWPRLMRAACAGQLTGQALRRGLTGARASPAGGSTDTDREESLATRYAAARRSLGMGDGRPVLIRTPAGRVAATMPAA